MLANSAPLVTSVKPMTWIALSDAVTPTELPTARARFVLSIQLSKSPMKSAISAEMRPQRGGIDGYDARVKTAAKPPPGVLIFVVCP